MILMALMKARNVKMGIQLSYRPTQTLRLVYLYYIIFARSRIPAIHDSLDVFRSFRKYANIDDCQRRAAETTKTTIGNTVDAVWFSKREQTEKPIILFLYFILPVNVR